MTGEGPRRRELAELVADHVLRHEHREELVTVIDTEGQADELRQDGRATRPRLDHFVPSAATAGLCLLQQIAIHKRTLPN